MVWNRIVNDINLIGPKKTINQAKKKTNNLKDAYRKAEGDTKKSGTAPAFSPTL